LPSNKGIPKFEAGLWDITDKYTTTVAEVLALYLDWTKV